MGEKSEVKNQAAESQDVSQEERDEQRCKYMTFKLGNEHFGLKIQYVNEIIQFQAITAIPETEDYIKGIINLRGKMIPVIDVRVRFKQEELEYNDRTCIIVISVKTTVVGLIVDSIAEVVEIKDENILPPPTIGRMNKVQQKYVYGIAKVGDSVKLLLDPDRLLNDEAILNIEQVNNTNPEEEV